MTVCLIIKLLTHIGDQLSCSEDNMLVYLTADGAGAWDKEMDGFVYQTCQNVHTSKNSSFCQFNCDDSSPIKEIYYFLWNKKNVGTGYTMSEFDITY